MSCYYLYDKEEVVYDMRNERHYFANGQGIKEQKHNLHFAVSELMDLAFSQGYFVEGYGNAISCSVLFRYLRRQKIIPTHFMEQYKQDILRDIQNARAQMEDEKSRCYNMGVSQQFFSSAVRWQFIHSIFPTVFIEDMPEDFERPYLMIDRSGKATMIEFLLSATNLTLKEIPLDDRKVFERLSAGANYLGHPYLPDSPAYDLGIWGIPGVGTKRTVRSLNSWSQRITDFDSLLYLTKEALSNNEEDDWIKDEPEDRISFAEAFLEAYYGYLQSWFYVYYPKQWRAAYRKAYTDSILQMKWEEESFDGDLLVEKSIKKYWEDLVIFDDAITKTGM